MYFVNAPIWETQENLTAAIIRAELEEDHQQFARVAANLNIWLKRPEQHDLRRVIKEWLIHMLQRRLPDIKVNEVQSLTEIETMLALDWSKKWKAEGEQAGIAKGEQIGIAKGEGNAGAHCRIGSSKNSPMPAASNWKPGPRKFWIRKVLRPCLSSV